jgi:RNA polymerase sigma factor (sigma-70 family)
MFNTALENLTTEELVTFVQAGASNDEETKDAQEIILQRHEGLIERSIWDACKKMKASLLYDEVQEDLHQTAYLGLFEAVQRYRRDRGAMFSTFAYLYIRGFVSDYIKREYCYRTGAESGEALDSLPLPEDIQTLFETKETQKEVGGFLSDLSSRQREVCLKLYWESRSQRQVGRDLGVSHKMVGKIVKQIHAKGMTTFGPHTIAS